MVFFSVPVRKIWHKAKTLSRVASSTEIWLDEIKMNQGKILAELHRSKETSDLKGYEFKIFSQWGEDGIIQRLIESIEIKNKTFIEFGVSDFYESNCRYLMMNNNWSGFVIDGSPVNIGRLRSSYFYWKYQLEAVSAFITRDNINQILGRSGFDADFGILSIDIDGIDYWVLEAIERYTARILILEYNAVFVGQRQISVPYDPDFCREKKHFSNLYFGASLPALTALAKKKGYVLVGTNSAGINAFYVRADLLNERLAVLAAEAAYTSSTARESRDPQGKLSLLSGDDRLGLIRGLPVVNAETGALESL